MAMKSRFSDVQIPENLSWPEFVYERFDEFGDRTAIIDGASGHSYTFTQLKTLTEKFASSLIKRGFQKGDVLAIYLPNVPEYPIIFYGVAYTGGKVTTVNPLYTAEELERQLQDTQAIYLVTSPPFLDKAQKACKVLGKIRKIFVVGGEGSDDCEAVSSLLDDDGSSFPTECMVDKDDVVTMPYSSGTTGLPKGVMITHHSMIANTCIIEAAKVFVIDQSSVVMTILPFYHIYGQLVMMGMALHQGGKLVVLQRFEPEPFLKTMQDQKVTNAPIVPPIILFLAKHPMVDKFDLTSVEEVTSGAAPMGKGLEEALIERMPKLKCVRQGFGMTEVLITHVQPGGERKSGSVGVLLPNLECKIVDVTTGAVLGPSQDGEICLRGPTIMKGYLNNPEATARMVDKDGWAHTGDIGHYDEDGHFFIVDRLKELIKYNALQVAPAELEALLISHQKIDDAAVIGVPDEKAGELPKAFVVPKGDITPEEIADFIAQRVAPHKKLSGGVEFIEKIPKSASGKILRKDLRKRESERTDKS
ncbi:4-coumarate--CoA ligase 1-like [Stylophora pistillata]|uniref:4-coumarate--CoA ligase 1-like n=1 Tax=Stylophora pistillata TaxID=50429 RepID=UPI000C04C4AD|nr:4-coumarate--CoA ligase 1-like [Stylophora pistillata]